MSNQSTDNDGYDLFPEIKTEVKVYILDPFGTPITGPIEFLHPDVYGTFGAMLEHLGVKKSCWPIANPVDERVKFALVVEAIN